MKHPKNPHGDFPDKGHDLKMAVQKIIEPIAVPVLQFIAWLIFRATDVVNFVNNFLRSKK